MKFIIADSMHESLFPGLESLGLAFDYVPDITTERLQDEIGNYEGIIIRSKIYIDDKFLDHAPNLKVVCRAGAGIDNLDVSAIKSRGIKIINAPEGNRDAVAEHCVGLLLNLMNKIALGNDQVRNGIWDREGNRGVELKDKTVGIIGYGNMGSAFAQRLSGFGCRIIVYDKYKTGFGDANVQAVSLENLLAEAQVLSLHIPLTEETRYWINEEFLARLQHPVYLLNTSRGEIISFKSIAIGLKSAKIVAAALDVLENEKLNQLSEEQQYFFEELKNSDKVIFTPHVAGWTVESYQRINEVMIKKLKNWLIS